ncbi:hypothetical protein KY290_032010 [Solanum tuberosum]|uniref:Uncharacterized protein n=2 Tax=Solanum tuberosum TaxID=4113 RepID=A0ABQ7UCP0_SOLTU|nr:PREDICTED: leucine-rich repeat extensin-like protein 3 [Solanum tuberosum]KAH0744017.1 hypothetical protein KY290_032010 [Solanum tuberosum]
MKKKWKFHGVKGIKIITSSDVAAAVFFYCSALSFPSPPPPHPTYSLPATSTTPPLSRNPYPLLTPPPPPNYSPPFNSNYHFNFSQSSYGTRSVIYQNQYPPYYHSHSNNRWGRYRPPPPPPPPVVGSAVCGLSKCEED